MKVETPAQILRAGMRGLIKFAKNRYLIDLATTIPEDDIAANKCQLEANVFAYEKGFRDATILWYKCLKSMDCYLPENRDK